MTFDVNSEYTERAKVQLRRQRQRNLYFLNSHIFGDPAWELVLETYIAASNNECVVLSELAIDLKRPVTITTRLAKILEAEGYVERCRSHKNRDLRCIRLTVDAAAWCEQSLDLHSDGDDFQNN